MPRHSPGLLLVAALPFAGSCSLVSALTEFVCLDDALSVSGLTREEIDAIDIDGDGKPDSDLALADALETAKAELGDLPVLDCAARDAATGFVGEVNDYAGTNPPEGDLPDKARDGDVHEVDGPDNLPDKVEDVVDQGPGPQPEVVVLIDTTGSMHDDAQSISSNWKKIRGSVADKDGRLGVAWYGDNQNCDSPWYSYNQSGLMDPEAGELSSFVDGILQSGLSGGCDWPESMYDAIYNVAQDFAWQEADRTIIVITDAEALEGSLTNHSKEEVIDLLDRNKIALDIIYVAVTY